MLTFISCWSSAGLLPGVLCLAPEVISAVIPRLLARLHTQMDRVLKIKGLQQFSVVVGPLGKRQLYVLLVDSSFAMGMTGGPTW